MITPEWDELEVKADLVEVDRVRHFLREKLIGLNISEEEELRLDAFYEIFVNIVLHAYAQEGGGVNIRIRGVHGNLHMEIRDRGVPFNPVEMPPVDLEEKLRRGTGGGLGVGPFQDDHGCIRLQTRRRRKCPHRSQAAGDSVNAADQIGSRTKKPRILRMSSRKARHPRPWPR